jgi:hypothetical protein
MVEVYCFLPRTTFQREEGTSVKKVFTLLFASLIAFSLSTLLAQTAAGQVKDGDRVIVKGTTGKDGVLHATLISKRLSHSPQQ